MNTRKNTTKTNSQMSSNQKACEGKVMACGGKKKACGGKLKK